MPFANEYLTDETEIEKYGGAHVTLDRERDAWLTRSGGGGERPEFLELHWSGEEIRMHAYESQTGTSESGLVITWKITKMTIPDKLETKRAEIIDLVRDALIAHKCGGLVQYDQLVKDVIVYFGDWIIKPTPGEPIWM